MDDKQSGALLLLEAKLHRNLAQAHDEYARDLSAVVGEIEETSVPELRGRIQRQIVALSEMFSEAGMSASEIARELDHDEANTYSVLRTLTESHVLEEVEGAKPRRWRMAVKHRRARVLRMSRLVPDGRWTTYGDFSIAVYDNIKMAITVGRVAAKNPAFVNPHRVLWSGGVIKDAWSDDEGQGPKECVRRLREDGIDVTDRVADKSKFIGWEDLKELLKEDERKRGLDEAA
jgi:alkylated DNA nucleotide flippase Atl1